MYIYTHMYIILYSPFMFSDPGKTVLSLDPASPKGVKLWGKQMQWMDQKLSLSLCFYSVVVHFCGITTSLLLIKIILFLLGNELFIPYVFRKNIWNELDVP